MYTLEPSFNTRGSAAIRPRRTPCPIAVRPEKQYAVAENAPLLAPAADDVTDTVFFTKDLLSFSSSVLFSTRSLPRGKVRSATLGCESVAIMRASFGFPLPAY